MQNVAVGWQLYSLTGSALDLGLVGLVQFVPTIALTLVVGQVADRCDRRLVVVVCHATEAGATAALALGSLGGWLGRDGILGMVAILGAARAFENPSRAALVPRLVPFALIPRAIASVTSAGQPARIVGPALGGVLYGLGPTAVYATVAALYLLAAALVGLVHAVQPAHEPEEMTPASLFSGMTFILRERLLLGLLSLDLFAVLLGGATALLPIYARDILDTGPWGLGLLRAAPACGALAMSVALTRRPVERHAGPVLFGGVLVFGVATVVFGASTWGRLGGPHETTSRFWSKEPPMKKLAVLVQLAGVLLLSGCAIGNRYAYQTVVASPQVSGTTAVSIATYDQREYVRSGTKDPQFVGLPAGDRRGRRARALADAAGMEQRHRGESRAEL